MPIDKKVTYFKMQSMYSFEEDSSSYMAKERREGSF